jgi:hypothetical protein
MRMMSCSNKDYSLSEVANDPLFPAAKFFRFGGRGDPARSKTDTEDAFKFCVDKGLDVIGYTHFPDEVPEWKDKLLASVSTWEEADRLVEKGWMVSIETSDLREGMRNESPKGHKFIRCPNELSPESINCGKCFRCSIRHKRSEIILFKHKHKGRKNGKVE